MEIKKFFEKLFGKRAKITHKDVGHGFEVIEIRFEEEDEEWGDKMETKAVPLRIVANRDAEYLCEAMGISEKRFKEMVDELREIYIKNEYLTDMLEAIIRRFDGKELVLALFHFGYCIGRRCRDTL